MIVRLIFNKYYPLCNAKIIHYYTNKFIDAFFMIKKQQQYEL